MSFMASAQSTLPSMAVGEWTTVGFIVKSAVGSMALLAVVCFAMLRMGLQTPKGQVGKDSGVHPEQKAPAKQKNKSGKAKKNKKTRGGKGGRKISEDQPDEETKDGVENSMSDVEAPSITESYHVADDNHASDVEAQATADLCNASDEDVAEAPDTVLIVTDCCDSNAKIMASTESLGVVEKDESKTKIDVSEDNDLHDMKDSVRVSVIQGNPEEHFWGCSTTRTYTSSLLLMHYEVQRAIARGPPGLELPAQIPASAERGLKVMKM